MSETNKGVVVDLAGEVKNAKPKLTVTPVVKDGNLVFILPISAMMAERKDSSTGTSKGVTVSAAPVDFDFKGADGKTYTLSARAAGFWVSLPVKGVQG